MEDEDTGVLLIKKNIETLGSFYFNEPANLIGTNVLFWEPLEGGDKWDGRGEPNNTFFYPPIKTHCFYNTHPSQKTMKGLGWDPVLDAEARVIVVDKNLKGVQYGAIFQLPSSYNDEGGLFKVIEMTEDSTYPVTTTLKLAPVIEDTFDNSQATDDGYTSALLVDVEDSDDPRFNKLRGKK